MGTSTQKKQPAAPGTKGDVLEPRVVALAEQLGRFMGTVAGKADGWLDRDKLRKELGRIRDGAAELLKHVNRRSTARKASAKPMKAAKKTMAPGKRHMKPPPQEVIDPRMGEPMGKQMGHKSFRPGKSRGRG